ncbi:MAG: FAD:protein FMN transferase [Acidobacteria bacterium]|nr:FAD:protein FMN transferase [Acidobacteriota bacterium]
MGDVPVEIRVDTGNDPGAFPGHLRAVAEEIERLEGLLSRFRPESQVSRLNRAAGGAAVAPGPEVLTVLETGLWLHRTTGGAFDVTVGPLVALWRDAGLRGFLPSGEETARALALVGSDSLEFDRRSGTVRLPRAGMAIDLDGVSKGYIVDRAVEVLRARGVRRGLVNAGGDLRAFAPAGSDPFRIGIRDPAGGAEAILGEVPLRDGAAATSGNYERFVEIGGRRYGHILDPRTGLPVDRVLSATVLAPEAMRAGGLATGLFLLGREAGGDLVESLPGVEAVLIYREGQDRGRWVSSGMPRVEWLAEGG